MSTYGVNLETRILDNLSYVVGNSDSPLLLLQPVLSPSSDVKVGTDSVSETARNVYLLSEYRMVNVDITKQDVRFSKW
jgi:hypothetical protein